MDDWAHIVTLLARYGELIDAGDFDGVGELFAHAEITATGMDPVRGAEAVAGLYRMTTRRYDDGTPRTRHLVTNPIVELDDPPERASARSVFTVLQVVDGHLQPIISGRYRDRFERGPEGWRFTARHMEPELIGDLSAHLLIPDPPPAHG